MHGSISSLRDISSNIISTVEVTCGEEGQFFSASPIQILIKKKCAGLVRKKDLSGLGAVSWYREIQGKAGELLRFFLHFFITELSVPV